MRIVEHASAVRRAETLVEKFDARIANAQRAGDLGFFNREFRQLQAQAACRPFMPYRAAQARLRKVLVATAVGNPAPIIPRMFGGGK